MDVVDEDVELVDAVDLQTLLDGVDLEQEFFGLAALLDLLRDLNKKATLSSKRKEVSCRRMST